MAEAVTLQVKVTAVEAERVEAALCASAGVPVTPANAKAAVIALIRRTVLEVEGEAAQKAAEAAADTELAAKAPKPVEGLS